MTGIVFALLYAFFLWLRQTEGPRIFQRSANFLFWWNVIIACLVGLAGILFFLLIGGIEVFSGWLMYLDLYGIIAGTFIIIFLFACAFLLFLFPIIGAHVLRTAVKQKEGVWTWSTGRLVVGFLFLFLQLALIGVT